MHYFIAGTGKVNVKFVILLDAGTAGSSEDNFTHAGLDSDR